MKKSKRSIFLIVLSFLFVISAVVGGGICLTTKEENEVAKTAAGPVNERYWMEDGVYQDVTWAGSGTQADPYLITNARDLAKIARLVYNAEASETSYGTVKVYFMNTYFKQTQDIDLSQYYWQPIGIYFDRLSNETYRYFGGSYDGQGYTIDGLFTPTAHHQPAYAYQGLFGFVFGEDPYRVTIKNVIIGKNSLISGNWQSAAIAGSVWGDVDIINCKNYATVKCLTMAIGGIVGAFDNHNTTYLGSIDNCENYGKVESTETNGQEIGGIAGFLGKATIKNSKNYGKVVAQGKYVGGICGYGGTSYQVLNCHNMAPIEGAELVGGICGYSNNERTLLYSYDGTITLNAGVRIPIWHSPVFELQKNYSYLLELDYRSDGISKFDIDFNPDTLPQISLVAKIGTRHLRWISTMPSDDASSCRLRIFDDLDSNHANNTYFTNLCLYNAPNYIYECSNYGSIKGQNGREKVGGIVGDALYTEVSKCFNKGSVSGDSCIGGIAGANRSDSFLDQCYNEGNVSSIQREAGGICGFISSSSVASNCYNLGLITSQIKYNDGAGAAGIVGHIFGSGRINNCINYGSVISYDSQKTGGIVAYLGNSGSNAYVYNCINLGSVSVVGSNSQKGSVFGYAQNSTIEYCRYYNNPEIPGYGVKESSNVTGLKKVSSASNFSKDNYNANMVDYAIYINSDWNQTYLWDFDEIWVMLDGVNDGFPVLQNVPCCDKACISFYDGEELLSNLNYDGNINVTLPTLTKVGYQFLGWRPRENVSPWDSAYIYNGTYTGMKGVIVLDAVWQKNQYTITFNGGDSPRQQLVLYDTETSLMDNTFARTGYTFEGWAMTSADAANGYVVYKDKQVIKNLTAENGVNINFYAVFKPILYTIEFDANGGSGSMANISATYDSYINLSTNKFVRDKFNFLGWATSVLDANAGTVAYTDEQAVINLKSVLGDSITLYAVWGLTARYDIKNNFWYVEIGNMPQTRVSRNFNLLLNGQTLVATENTYNITDTITLTSYLYGGKEYCKYNGQWYLVEPVRWRLAGEYTKSEIVTDVTKAILSKIVFVGAYSDGNTTYSDLSTSKFLATLARYEETTISMTYFAPNDLDGYNDKMYVASESEISSIANGFDIEFSDLVCDLLGDRYYFTRTAGSDTGMMKVFSFTGISSNRLATLSYGVQFIIEINKFSCI